MAKSRQKSRQREESRLADAYAASARSRRPPARAARGRGLPLLIGLAVAALLVSGAAWYLSPGPRGPETIKVGAVLPLTGPLAIFGEPERAALQMAVEDANAGGAGGGINGRRVELVIEDSRGTARDGVSAAQKVMLQQPAAVITSLTIISNATQQLLAEEKTPQVALSVHPTIAAQSPYTVRPYYGFDQEMRFLAGYLRGLGRRRVAVLWVMVPECEAAVDQILTPEFGDALVASESYAVTDTNVRPQLTKIAAAEPDAILVMDFGNLFGLILREAETLKVRDRIVGNIGLLTAPRIDAELLEGIAFSGPDFVIDNSPEYQRFAEDFRRRTSMEPTYDVLYTRHAFDLLVDVLRRSADGRGRVNVEALRDGLRNAGAHRGVTGTMNVTDGSAAVGLRMGVYRNGKIEPLTPGK